MENLVAVFEVLERVILLHQFPLPVGYLDGCNLRHPLITEEGEKMETDYLFIVDKSRGADLHLLGLEIGRCTIPEKNVSVWESLFSLLAFFLGKDGFLSCGLVQKLAMLLAV